LPLADPWVSRIVPDEEDLVSDTGDSRSPRVSDATREADRRDAQVTGHADRQPTPEEDAAAPTEVDPEVAESYEEALERGANTKGEGRIGV
jgi:hypothetical protein